VFAALLVLGAIGLWENLIPIFLAVAGLSVGACLLMLTSGNPNRDLEANKETAADLIDDRIMRVVEERDEDNEPPPDKKGAGFMAALLLSLLGVLFMPASEWVRLMRGWSVNRAWAPVVAGPGDAPWTFFDQHVECVKGYWSGSGQANVTNPQELGLANGVLPITSSQASWGNSITAKNTESRSNPRLWARVHFPNDPNLAGKRLQMTITLNVVFPAPIGNNQFGNQTRTFHHATTVVLASPGAGSLYTTLWWLGGLGGSLLVLVGNVVLILTAKAYRDQGLETRVVPLKKNRKKEEDEDEEDED
jgi:hypothetical protein